MPTQKKYPGKKFLVQKEHPTEIGTYVTIFGLRSNSMTINDEEVDVSNKSDHPWRQLLADAGMKSMSISGSGLASSDDTFSELMEAVMGTKTNIINFRIVSGRGDKFVGPFQITSLERTGEYNGAEEFSISLSSADEIVYNPSPLA